MSEVDFIVTYGVGNGYQCGCCRSSHDNDWEYSAESLEIALADFKIDVNRREGYDVWIDSVVVEKEVEGGVLRMDSFEGKDLGEIEVLFENKLKELIEEDKAEVEEQKRKDDESTREKEIAAAKKLLEEAGEI